MHNWRPFPMLTGRTVKRLGAPLLLALPLWLYAPCVTGAEKLTWESFTEQSLGAQQDSAFHSAASLYQKLLHAQQKARPSLHLMQGLQRLVNFHLQQQQLPQAESVQNTLLQQMEALFGPFDLLLVAPLTQLASLQSAQRHTSQARQTLERALTIADETQHATPLLTIPILQQLVILHTEQDNLGDADRLQQRILEIQEQALMMETPGDAIILASQGKLQLKNGHKESAASFFQQSKEILLETSGPYHSARTEVLFLLATILLEEEEYPQAIELLKSALAIAENMRGTNHPDLLPILQRLANAYQKMAKPNLSRALFTRILSLTEEKHGTAHEKTAEVILDLADNYRLENQAEPAVELYSRALTILRHREVATGMVRSHLGQAKAMRMLGRNTAALRNVREALEWSDRVIADKGTDWAPLQQQLAELQTLQEEVQLPTPKKDSTLALWQQLQEHLLPLSGAPFLPTPVQSAPPP
ncbi:MAG: tetratricopeptide repeat protein [Magnetococcales bacterium]|nr:tetratricopeptide repeat protein [Magnetococcales bacterium]MBF0116371.1 tetratricopeptide repeat protein [Magnetococcales bacterium]